MTSRSTLFLSSLACTVTLSIGTAHAAVRSTPLTLPSSSSSSSSSALSVPSTPVVTSVSNQSTLPTCGDSNEDAVLVWNKKMKKWSCRAVSSLVLPPICTGADHVLRFDGTKWKCEVVGGLLVAHTAFLQPVKGSGSCDTSNTWGGATCTKQTNGTYKLACPFGTLKVETSALSGYELAEKAYSSNFGGEWHAFCYSKPIKIAK